MNGGRVNLSIFYENNKKYKIVNDDFNDLLFKVSLDIGGRKESAHVTFFEEHITSVEFKKSKRYCLGKKVEVGGVKLGRSDKFHASAIDRHEHGREEH